MELGMFTSGYQRYPLERAFSDAGRLGYDYIELWGGRPHAFAPDLRLGGVAEIRSMVEKYQMPVYVYTPEHHAYPYNYMAGGRAQWEDSMEYLELCLEMGKALGAEYTLISVGHGGYSVPRRALWARSGEDSLTGLFLRTLRSGALEGDGLELAARFGLAALENGEDPCL